MISITVSVNSLILTVYDVYVSVQPLTYALNLELIPCFTYHCEFKPLPAIEELCDENAPLTMLNAIGACYTEFGLTYEPLTSADLVFNFEIGVD